MIVSGGWNTVANTDNPNLHASKLSVRILTVTGGVEKEIIPYQGVTDDVVAEFTLPLAEITTGCQLKFEVKAQWESGIYGSVDTETITCESSQTIDAEPNISASIVATTDYPCPANTFLKDTDNGKPTATITAEAWWGGNAAHYYALYKIEEDALNPGTLVETFVQGAAETVAAGKTTHTFTIENGKPGRYIVKVGNGKDNTLATCHATTAEVEIKQPTDMLVAAKEIGADNGTSNGYIKLDGIDGGNGPDYKWTWYDGTCALTSTGVGGTGSAPEISGLAVREREADCTTLGSVLLESKAFTVEVADYKGCWLKKDFTVLGNKIQVSATTRDNSCSGNAEGQMC